MSGSYGKALLKRAGLSSNQLLYYYTSVIRPVFEYCVPVWHYALTKEQTQQLEAIQKCAIYIIVNFAYGMPYTSMLYAANISTLVSRRDDILQKFFRDITQPSSCFHLPAPKKQSLISQFRTYEKFPRVYTCTRRYCSFVNYALNNYQDKITNP